VSKCWRVLPRHLPIVGTNGARGADDVIRFLLSGARAVEFASLVLTEGPSVFTLMLKELDGYCARKDIARLADLVGRAADQALSYAELPVVNRSSYPWEKPDPHNK
jgi:dihydroorotate dehydrogenase